MSFLSRFTSGFDSSQEYVAWSAPMPWRSDDAVYVGATARNQVWMYRALDLIPMKWEDSEKRMGATGQLRQLLTDLGNTSKDPIAGVRQLSNNREIHLVSVTWEEVLMPPEGNPPALAEFQRDAYGVLVPRRALLLGTRLQRTILDQDQQTGRVSTKRSAISALKSVIAEDVPDLSPYDRDRALVGSIMDRASARIPTRAELAQLESWFNSGRGQDVLIEELPDRLIIDKNPTIQMKSVRAFDRAIMEAPDDTWLMDALSHPGDRPHLVSVRGQLEPVKTARARARQSQRRILSNIETQQKSGDLEKSEHASQLELTRETESYLVSGQDSAILSSVSIVLASEVTRESEKYVDFMENAYGIEFSDLKHRQFVALDETMPCSMQRANPHLQDVNIPMLARSGVQAFSELGDDKGMFAGFVDPDGAPLFIDPTASSRRHRPPAFGVFGEPGSGKSSPVNTPVFTPSGVTTMGRLKEGDVVMGQAGSPVSVVGVFPQGTKEDYQITLHDGRTIVTSYSHLLTVQDADDPKGEWVTTSVEELDKAGIIRGSDLDDPYAPWHVPLPMALHHMARVQDVDPRQLGGYLTGAETPDGVDAQLVEKYGLDRIHNDYLFGSIPQREALLNGFMDNGGHVDYDAGLFVSPPLERMLALDFQALVWSLGGGALLSYPDPQDEDQRLVVEFELPASITPFTDKHRGSSLERYPVLTLPIVSILPLSSSSEHVCIKVDAEDSLYVSGEYFVTHNTFFAQSLATQTALSGMKVFFINPKGFDNLEGLPGFINSRTSKRAQMVSLRAVEQTPGAFDPFRFAANPLLAAEYAADHIFAALDDQRSNSVGIPPDERFAIQAGLKAGAAAGAQCTMDALKYIVDPDIRRKYLHLVEQAVQASTLFAVGVAREPLPRLGMDTDLTLLNFDRDIGLPATVKDVYEPAERIALSVIQLVSKAAIEILASSGGGMFILDEAWTFLNQPQALAILDRLSREGRSLNVITVFLTQQIKDVISKDLEGYLSRVLVLKLTDEEEAAQALRICGLKSTPERLDLLRQAGPEPPKNGNPAKWAQGIFRDLDLRHAWVALGPTPEDAAKAWSTSPEDRQKRKAAMEAEAAALAQKAESRQDETPNQSSPDTFDPLAGLRVEVATTVASYTPQRPVASPPEAPIVEPPGELSDPDQPSQEVAAEEGDTGQEYSFVPRSSTRGTTPTPEHHKESESSTPVGWM